MRRGSSFRGTRGVVCGALTSVGAPRVYVDTGYRGGAVRVLGLLCHGGSSGRTRGSVCGALMSLSEPGLQLLGAAVHVPKIPTGTCTHACAGLQER